jgi:hypothetical protein
VVDDVAEMTTTMIAVHHQESLQKRIQATAVLADVVLQAEVTAAATTIAAVAVLLLTEMTVKIYSIERIEYKNLAMNAGFFNGSKKKNLTSVKFLCPGPESNQHILADGRF